MTNQTEVVFKKIGEKLKRLRIAAGYSSYETFAQEHDLSRRYYWGAEKGQNLSIQYLIKLLNIHHISIEDFFAELDA